MWIMLNDAFFSVVMKHDDPDTLVVRARRPNDLTKYFPGLEEHETDGTDYQFRVFATRAQVQEGLAQQVTDLDYTNFKDSVQEHNLHNAYVTVWSAMERLQPRPAYGSRSKG